MNSNPNIIVCKGDNNKYELDPTTSNHYPPRLITLGYDEIANYHFNDLTSSPFYKLGSLFDTDELATASKGKLGKSVDIESIQITEITKVFSFDKINIDDKYLKPWLEKHGDISIDDKGVLFCTWGRVEIDENSVIHKTIAKIHGLSKGNSVVIQFYQILTQATLDLITYLQQFFEFVYFYHPFFQYEIYPTRYLVCLNAKEKLPSMKIPTSYLERIINDSSSVVQNFVKCSNSIYLTEKLENYQRISHVISHNGETTDFHTGVVKSQGIKEQPQWVPPEFVNMEHDHDPKVYTVIRANNIKYWIQTFMVKKIDFKNYLDNYTIDCAFV
jgi:hypothetical protein